MTALLRIVRTGVIDDRKGEDEMPVKHLFRVARLQDLIKYSEAEDPHFWGTICL
jgi:hypothetical protein